ncbi:MAG: dethiobiotin synthase [Hyphomicrobium sp.]|nr:dethiobiotin synthase [Hyphomicrobium sp.]
MTSRIVVAGTDTDIGKTVFAAALVRAIGGVYWKPIQAGLDGETDSETVARLAGLSPDRIVDEAYRLRTPASPHFAAERDNVEIDEDKLRPQPTADPLVIELAGGLLVPITRQRLQIDVVAAWHLPVIVCAATRLGTINHTLLSIEALKRREIAILGVAFIGDENTDSRRTICEFGGVQCLGRLPRIDPLTPERLHEAFAKNFDATAWLSSGAPRP